MTNFGFAVMCCLSGGSIFGTVDAGLAPTIEIWPSLTITRQHMTATPTLMSFILFLMHWIKFRENVEKIYNQIFWNKNGSPRLLVGESTLLIHARRTVIYVVVIVSRNLERTNQNNWIKMTALECKATVTHQTDSKYPWLKHLKFWLKVFQGNTEHPLQISCFTFKSVKRF